MTDLDRLLDAGLADGAAGPRFEAQLQARLDRAREAEEAALDALLALDSPVPGQDFDARVRAALDGTLLRFRRRRVVTAVLGLAAAACLAFLFWRRAPAPVEPSPTEADVAMLADLELLEHYEELAVLDGIEDPDVFALVAQLDVIEEVAQ